MFFNGVRKACRCIMQRVSESKEKTNESSKRYKSICWKKISISSQSPSSSERAIQRRKDALRDRGLLPPLQPTMSVHGREPEHDARTLVEEIGIGNEVLEDKMWHEDEARPVMRDVLEWLAEVDVHRGYTGGDISFVETSSSCLEDSDLPTVSPLLDRTPDDCRHSMLPGERRPNDVESSTPSPSHSERSSLTCATDFSSVPKKGYEEGLRIDIPIVNSSPFISRTVLDITIHSHGTIMMETSHIEDDESRRLTELAYLA
ncbi:hypothetical protein DFS33DRAFT_741569 [Desarmillaria ectypa]|nr:hypothetical protein DFS33DRAFT_741569 [Desarmillaria ectypa]